MKVIKAGYEILTPINRVEFLKAIEVAGRVCYKSEDKITDESSSKFVKSLIKNGHMAMIECGPDISVKFICDRGVSHEIVRHRLFSFAQESTRFCNYSKGKYGSEITVIEPCFWEKNSSQYLLWETHMRFCEQHYLMLIDEGCPAQEARSVLPNSLKTEIVVKGNLREWIHFFNLRAIGTTGKPHPQMVEIALPLLREMQQLLPEIFENVGGK